jgi:hypothetical protein
LKSAPPSSVGIMCCSRAAIAMNWRATIAGHVLFIVER